MSVFPSHRITSSRAALLGVTLISLAFALLHAGPLNGSLVALIVTIGLQVYLAGRAAGAGAGPAPA